MTKRGDIVDDLIFEAECFEAQDIKVSARLMRKAVTEIELSRKENKRLREELKAIRRSELEGAIASATTEGSPLISKLAHLALSDPIILANLRQELEDAQREDRAEISRLREELKRAKDAEAVEPKHIAQAELKSDVGTKTP